MEDSVLGVRRRFGYRNDDVLFVVVLGLPRCTSFDNLIFLYDVLVGGYGGSPGRYEHARGVAWLLALTSHFLLSSFFLLGNPAPIILHLLCIIIFFPSYCSCLLLLYYTTRSRENQYLHKTNKLESTRTTHFQDHSVRCKRRDERQNPPKIIICLALVRHWL